MRYVAEGFKTNQSKAIFNIEDKNLDKLLLRMGAYIQADKPDIILIRCVKEVI